VSVRLAADTDWARRGHEIAVEQFKTPARTIAVASLRLKDMQPVAFTEAGPNVVVTGKGFAISFDRKTGVMKSWKAGGKDMIVSGPQFTFWRAPTDNDEAHWRLRGQKTMWLEAGLDRLLHVLKDFAVYQPAPQAVVISARIRSAAKGCDGGFDIEVVYTIYGSGDVVMSCDVMPDVNLSRLPRIGVELTVPKSFDRFTWFGRGPHENYIDRREGALVGLYSSSVDEQYTNYAYPQENGNKTDVRWAALTGKNGSGLLAVGTPNIEASAQWFTTDDFYRAKHICDLKKRDFVTLHLDYRQTGLGNMSCGPDTLPQYQLKPEPARFSLRLRPVAGSTDRLVQVSRVQLEEV
jgi:hypothetical protein